MNLSYWEIKSWLSNVDFTVVGSGIVGLNCALQLKKSFPKSKIVVLEKGVLPQGASTKNAGFACFGSLSEILEDLKTHTEDEVFNLVKKRIDGLRLLRETMGDANMDYKEYGGYELFTENNLLEDCLDNLASINSLLNPLFQSNIFEKTPNVFGFKNISGLVFNKFEGQIDTGKMMQALLKIVRANDIMILNNINLESFTDNNTNVLIKTNRFELTTNKLLIANNGFASQLLDENVKPARAQVLITKPIKNLEIQGTFHLDKGYYYFRNIDNRILLGGGRNLDFETEETFEFGETELIQNKLNELLSTTILPNIPVEIEHQWSGIMGIGTKKKPIVRQLSNNVFCGVRLGGMGVAIGSLVGKELADLL